MIKEQIAGKGETTALPAEPAPYARESRPPNVVVLTAADVQYAVEFFVSPSVVEGPAGEFEIDFVWKYTVAPSSAIEPDALPSPMFEGAPFEVVAASGSRHRFEFGYAILSITTNGSKDGGVPNFDLHMRIDFREVPAVPAATAHLFCWYCNEAHPGAGMSEEHIIPRVLFSNSYVLRSVCQRLNSYMAHAFEKRVVTSTAMREILLLAEPPKKEVRRGKAVDATGKEYDRWVTPSGDWVLRALPTTTETRTFALPVDMPDGRTSYCDIVLPFDIRTGVTASPEFLKDRARRTERDRVALEQHLASLVADPSRDPTLRAFLETTGGTIRLRPIVFSESALLSKTETPTDLLDEPITLDDETFARFFIKIAWTHSVRQFGRRAALNPLAIELFTFLTSAHVNDRRLVERYPQLVTAPVDIGGQPYAFWRHSIPKGRALAVEICTDEADRAALERHFTRRQRDIESVGRIFRYRKAVKVNVPNHEGRQKMRSHTLSLSTFRTADGASTLCSIKLFGGHVDVAVLVADEPLAQQYPPPKHIRFPDGRK